MMLPVAREVNLVLRLQVAVPAVVADLIEVGVEEFHLEERVLHRAEKRDLAVNCVLAVEVVLVKKRPRADWHLDFVFVEVEDLGEQFLPVLGQKVHIFELAFSGMKPERNPVNHGL